MVTRKVGNFFTFAFEMFCCLILITACALSHVGKPYSEMFEKLCRQEDFCFDVDQFGCPQFYRSVNDFELGKDVADPHANDGRCKEVQRRSFAKKVQMVIEETFSALVGTNSCRCWEMTTRFRFGAGHCPTETHEQCDCCSHGKWLKMHLLEELEDVTLIGTDLLKTCNEWINPTAKSLLIGVDISNPADDLNESKVKTKHKKIRLSPEDGHKLNVLLEAQLRTSEEYQRNDHSVDHRKKVKKKGFAKKLQPDVCDDNVDKFLQSPFRKRRQL